MGAATTDAERKAAILRVIEPISGEVSLERYEPVRDAPGTVVAKLFAVRRDTRAPAAWLVDQAA